MRPLLLSFRPSPTRLHLPTKETPKKQRKTFIQAAHKRGCHFVASCEPCSTIAAIWSASVNSVLCRTFAGRRVTTNRAIMNRFRLPSTTTRGSSVWQCCWLAIVLFSFPKAWHPPRAECLNWNLMTRDLLSHIDSGGCRTRSRRRRFRAPFAPSSARGKEASLKIY